MATAPVTILADQVPPMQWSLIEEALRHCDRASVIAKDVPANELRGAIEQYSPDVLILGSLENLRDTAAFENWLGGTRRRRRIIALRDGLRVMQLSEWRLTVETLSEASIDTLCAAIEGRC